MQQIDLPGVTARHRVDGVAAASPHVAVLLATHNSSRFIAEQLESLTRNHRPFTLYWVDDESTDSTVEDIRSLAARLGIRLVELRAARALGVPGTFFFLLDQVEADVYLFCDHDDIWEPGKIDATVAEILKYGDEPVFCFSEPKLFVDGHEQSCRRYFDVIGVSEKEALDIRKALVFNPAVGNTVGINRSLRDLYLTHATVAKSGAAMHDWWLYLLAATSGKVRFMTGCPTTLYRQHRGNAVGVTMKPWALKRALKLSTLWAKQKRYRLVVARQAKAYIAVANALDRTDTRDTLLGAAAVLARVAERQSLRAIATIISGRNQPVGALRALKFLVGCLLSDAR